MAERGLADYRAGSEDKMDLFRQVVSPKTGRAEKIRAAFKIIREFLPNNERTDKIIESYFRDTSKLPFSPEKLEYKGSIGGGAACDALLLESQEDGLPSYVVKVQRAVHPRVKGPTIEETASNMRREYERIRDLYCDVPEIIPKEFTVVIESPFRFNQEPMVALVQSYYGRNIRDLFTEITPQEIEALCETEPEFKQTLNKFITTTQQIYDDKQEIVDLFGPKNLSVIENSGKHSLMLLDPHLTYSPGDMKYFVDQDPEDKLTYLRTLQLTV